MINKKRTLLGTAAGLMISTRALSQSHQHGDVLADLGVSGWAGIGSDAS